MDFIPVLERSRDICRLDFYMLDHVCRDVRRWLDEGKHVKRISVNLSRRHMKDPDLFTHIVEIIDRNNVPRGLIEVELTETTTDVEFKDLKRVVSELQEAGIAASVDDFGVGYSSLNLIKQIPWDVLKLDKSILPTGGEDIERGTRMFAHVIAMAHEMGLICVAEGVETEEQLSLMKEYGCRIAQGFLFERPIPAEDFEKWLL
jgi:EAL domain-containing protein (putative c-di-GMP-specific phosphodiesterase class I)